jgi:hypothetical protein
MRFHRNVPPAIFADDDRKTPFADDRRTPPWSVETKPRTGGFFRSLFGAGLLTAPPLDRRSPRKGAVRRPVPNEEAGVSRKEVHHEFSRTSAEGV